MNVLEPHVGSGTFIDALITLQKEQGITLNISVSDIDPDVRGMHRFENVIVIPPCDFLNLKGNWDIVLGNPPFSATETGKKRGKVIAHEHIMHALTVADTVGMIVRTGLLTTSSKRKFALHHHPFLRYEYHPRPSFTDGSTDTTEYLFGLWSNDSVKYYNNNKQISISKILDWEG
jgi:hypothetical protein